MATGLQMEDFVPFSRAFKLDLRDPAHAQTLSDVGSCMFLDNDNASVVTPSI
jgi:hypothetical protein